MKHLFFLLMLASLPFNIKAQGSTSVLKSEKEITWLGLDFSLVNFIGPATQWQDAGEITSLEIRDKYILAWNYLFIKEQKKYDVAKYIDRPSVIYATEVTEKANNNKRADYFTDDPNLYHSLTAEKIASYISKYNFMGKTGTGMLFIIEGMSKGKEETCAWVTFLDMGSRKVLQTKRISGSAGGFGFKNYWAKSFLNILKNVSAEMR